MRKLAPRRLRLKLSRETVRVLPRVDLVGVVGGETKEPDGCMSLLVAGTQETKDAL